MRSILLCLFGLCVLWVSLASASIELAIRGQKPIRIDDVYLRDGYAYVALDDVLQAVKLKGEWQSVQHRYTIRSPFGEAWISPGSSSLHYRDRSISLSQPPRFIDGRLRVTEAFLQNQLPLLTGNGVYFRNLEPLPQRARAADNPMDELFSFLLRKKRPVTGPVLRAVAIDPAHGGLDTGVVVDEVREKDLSLQVARQIEKTIKMRLGVPVYLSRDADYNLTVEKRLEPARREDVDAWLIVHAQASNSPAVKGVSLFVRGGGSQEGGDTSMVLARAIAGSLRQAKIPFQGIYRSSRVGLGQGNLPTVLIECGYLSHDKDRQRLQQEADPQLAKAIFAGLKRFAETTKEKRK